MKNPLDPRHKKRQKTVEDLFKNSFFKQSAGEGAKQVRLNLDEIDESIKKLRLNFQLIRSIELIWQY